MDRIGVLGLMLTALGAAIVLSVQSSMPLWAKWLVGPFLWYSGIAFILVWALLRAFPLVKAKQEEEEEETVRVPEKAMAFVPSNFLEHDFHNVA